MGKYTVNHSCGHEQEHQLYGKIVDRESKMEWLEGQDCTDCWRKAQDAKRKAEIEQANQQASEYLSKRPGLPTLTGSDKQIAWANTIRAGILAEAEVVK